MIVIFNIARRQCDFIFRLPLSAAPFVHGQDEVAAAPLHFPPDFMRPAREG
jgi:hypothetical protein